MPLETSFAFRIQYNILGIVGFSILSIFLGSFPIGNHQITPQTPMIWGDFQLWNFWETFAIFFPIVTGIMAGISMSGSLKNPRKSLPEGTLSAMGLTLVVYIGLSFWLARYVKVDDLIANETILVDKAFWGPAILAGILGATFSSALGSIIAAPRVMQALAQNKLLPFSRLLARETEGGEPRIAMLATALIGFVALLIALGGGGLNAIARVISMFFIITYGMLNVVVFIEQMLNMVSFRPMFRVPRFIPFIGMVGCLFVMFLIDPTFSLIAIVLVVGLYWFLARRHLSGDGSDDVRSGLFITLANWAANRATNMPSAPERSWKPMVLIPVRSSGELNGSYRFLWALTAPQGSVNALGIYPPEDMSKLVDLESATQAFLKDGINAESTLLEEEDFVGGVRAATQILRGTFFRPNILFLHLREDSKLNELKQLIDKTAAYKIGIVLLAKHPTNDIGLEQIINVWVSQFGEEEFDKHTGRYDLSILLTLQLQRNWKGQINLCMAVDDDEHHLEVAALETFLLDLISQARLPRNSRSIVINTNFEEALQKVPRADFSVFGLVKHPSLSFCQKLVTLSGSSCMFVRDSGEESVFV